MDTMNHTCQECGCVCESCISHNSLHLHQEIEALKRQLLERECHIMRMETRVMQEVPDEMCLRQEVAACQDKWQRLQEGYRKLQKVNQGLEDKLLKVVDKFETEKSALTRDVQELTNHLVDARLTIAQLREENEQYRNDCNVAVQLLQCKPSNFVASKYSSLPNELQEKVRNHLGMQQRCVKSPTEPRVIRVPMPTFPPTAMVYSVPPTPEEAPTPEGAGEGGGVRPPPDYISAAIMAKVLEERARERRRAGAYLSKGTQASLCCIHHPRSMAGDGIRSTETVL
ncbi:tight junction-associated protein 1-like [Ornithodoros turicata]